MAWDKVESESLGFHLREKGRGAGPVAWDKWVIKSWRGRRSYIAINAGAWDLHVSCKMGMGAWACGAHVCYWAACLSHRAGPSRAEAGTGLLHFCVFSLESSLLALCEVRACPWGADLTLVFPLWDLVSDSRVSSSKEGRSRVNPYWCEILSQEPSPAAPGSSNYSVQMLKLRLQKYPFICTHVYSAYAVLG